MFYCSLSITAQENTVAFRRFKNLAAAKWKISHETSQLSNSLTVKPLTGSAHKNNVHKRATDTAYHNRFKRNYQIDKTHFSFEVEIDRRSHWLMIRLFSKLGKQQILAPSDYLIGLTMPKKKNVSSSSDSDSGPDDVSTVFPHNKYISKSYEELVLIFFWILQRTPAKKTKTESTSSGQKTKEGIVFDLDSKKRVTVREFKGKTYIDIREFYEKDGQLLPGKKGIALQPEQWRKLIGMADDINSALSEVWLKT